MATTQTDIEIARYVSKLIFQFLFGKTLAEIEAEMLETTPAGQEHHAKQVHEQAIDRLRSIGLHMNRTGLDPVEPAERVMHVTSAEQAARPFPHEQSNSIRQKLSDLGALADIEPQAADKHQTAVDRLESMSRGFSSARARRPQQ